MEDRSKYTNEDFQLIFKELDSPIKSFGAIAVRLCELVSCENCPVVIYDCDNRTDHQKQVLHYPCCEQLHNWIINQSKNYSVKNANYTDCYEPMCPYGYADCIYDCNYIKTLYPDWYKELGSPTECNDCKDGNMYDDEDK